MKETEAKTYQSLVNETLDVLLTLAFKLHVLLLRIDGLLFVHRLPAGVAFEFLFARLVQELFEPAHRVPRIIKNSRVTIIFNSKSTIKITYKQIC